MLHHDAVGFLPAFFETGGISVLSPWPSRKNDRQYSDIIKTTSHKRSTLLFQVAIRRVRQGAFPQLPASVKYFENGLADVVSIPQDRLKASNLFLVSMEWPVETAAPAAVAGARAEQPGIAEVRVAQPGVAEVLAEQPDERWKSIADLSDLGFTQWQSLGA